MKYKNKLTGIIIDTKSVLAGDLWEQVDKKAEPKEPKSKEGKKK